MSSYGVVVPAYNAEATIAEALASITDQSVPPDKIIVVDDGSTDASATVAETFDPRITVIRQENAGPGAATTAGAAACQCRVLAFLDADDIWLPNKMAVQLAELDKCGGPTILGARMRQFRDGMQDEGSGKIQDGLTRSTMVLPAKIFDAVGPFVDPYERRGDLIDWLGRARHMGIEVKVLKSILALRRIHPGSLSYGRNQELDKAYLLAARAALLRNRSTKPGS